MLPNQIENGTLGRIGAAPSDFLDRLLVGGSELAQWIARAPYAFYFLDVIEGAAESDFQALKARAQEDLVPLLW